MIINMSADATDEQIDHVAERVRECGFAPHVIRGVERTLVGAVGSDAGRRGAIQALKAAPGVEDVLSLTHPFVLASREFRRETSVVRVGDVEIGGDGIVVIAGPCSVESREQILETARAVRDAGGHLLRGGAYKPRTSPYEFQGLGVEALCLLAEAREETGLPVVTEVMSEADVELVADHADMLQIGARNMQNFALLRRVAKSGRPVLLKRGASASIKEWLLAAEYLLAGGNADVVLCERGIKTFDTELRNTLDLAGVARVKELSHLPVIVDPSHATGRRSVVPHAARAAVAVGADGVIMEIHPDPERALSDGQQSLHLETFAELMRSLAAPVARALAPTLIFA